MCLHAWCQCNICFNHSAAASVSVINITENILNIVSYHIGREQLDLQSNATCIRHCIVR